MSEPAAKRHPIDLDEFDRRLRAPSAASPQVGAKDDPLAELARLVSSSPDPFAPIFSGGRPAPRPQKPSGPPPGFRPAFDESAPQQAGFAPPPVPPRAQPRGERTGASAYAPAHNARKARRSGWLVGGAVVVVLAGVGATFLLRDHVRLGAPPTILADSSPYKIKPPTKPVKDKVEDSTTLLNKNDAIEAPARVVNTAEQPVDLSVAAPAPEGASASAANDGFAFPAPRRVKTVLVRPDGTIISQDAEQPDSQAAADSSGATSLAEPPAAQDSPPPAQQQADAQPAAPTSPAPPPAPVGSAPDAGFANVVDEAAQRPAPRAAPPAAASAPVEAPVRPQMQTAEIAPSPPLAAKAPAAAGSWDVQLAAPGSAHAADIEVKRLEKRFGNVLSERSLVVHSAQSNGRTVFRVRVADLSREDATTLCGRLKSSGGACFVIHD